MINEKRLIEFIPIISGYTVLAGILKAISFYWVFGIRIIPFLDLGECLLMFLDDIIIAAAFILIEFAIISAFDNKTNRNKKKEHISTRLIIVSVTIAIGILWLASLFIFHLSDKSIVLAKIFSFFILTFFGPMLLFIKLKSTKYFDTNEKFLRMKAIFIGAFFLSIMVTWGAFEGYNLRFRSNSLYHFSIISKSNKAYTSNDSLYYIGITSKYLFLGNRKKDEKIIIPKEEVIELKFGYK